MGNGGNNILNRSAMDMLEALGRQVPVLASHVDTATDQLRQLPAISNAIVRLETRMDHVLQRLDEEPMRCPFRETAAIVPYIEKTLQEAREAATEQGHLLAEHDGRLDDQESQIEDFNKRLGGVENTTKKAAGIAAVITTALTTIGNLLGQFLGRT